MKLFFLVKSGERICCKFILKNKQLNWKKAELILTEYICFYIKKICTRQLGVSFTFKLQHIIWTKMTTKSICSWSHLFTLVLKPSHTNSIDQFWLVGWLSVTKRDGRKLAISHLTNFNLPCDLLVVLSHVTNLLIWY